VSSVVGDSQINLILITSETLSCLAVSCCKLYFAHCCALKWTGKFMSESKVMSAFILTDVKKWCNDVSFLTSTCINNNYFEIEKS